MTNKATDEKHISRINRYRKKLRTSDVGDFTQIGEDSLYVIDYEGDEITINLNRCRIVFDRKKYTSTYVFSGVMFLVSIVIMLMIYYEGLVTFLITLPLFLLMFFYVIFKDFFESGRLVVFNWSKSFISVENTNIFIRLVRLNVKPNYTCRSLLYSFAEVEKFFIKHERRVRGRHGNEVYYVYKLMLNCLDGDIKLLEHTDYVFLSSNEAILNTILRSRR